MSTVKIALCQFASRDERSFRDLENHLREQCQIAISSGADIIVFPELVTFGLLAMAGPELRYKHLHEAIIKYVANFTPIYEAIFADLARRSGTVIVAGSHWVMDEKEGKGFNTGYLFLPDGRIEQQKKNHLYPSEVEYGTATFDGLTTFETPKARIGLMICYDAEFPEVAQEFTVHGAQILFCPSATYRERGYYRVRNCCAARAIENQIYVAECHSAGSMTLPTDEPITAFGRSAILCPIDDQIKVNDGIIVEADSCQEERVVVGEVDLEALERSRQSSEATILKDRRPETYEKYYKLHEKVKL